jgi:Putative DNA-binding domain
VNHSLRGVDVETLTSEWRKSPAWRPRPAARMARRTGDGVLARRDRTRPIDLLAARYPVIRRLVGAPSFNVAVRRFILSEPSSTPIPRSYGDGFPRFIRSLGKAACIEYVADVAELEMLRQKAKFAAHAQLLGAPALSSLPVERLRALRIFLHPSVCLVQSRFPIVTIWENNRTDDGDGKIQLWIAEAAIVARPFLKVEVRRLPSGGYAFLSALSEEKTVATAVQIATEVSPKFDVASNLTLLDDAKVVVGIQEAGMSPKRSTRREWKIIPERSRFATANAWSETLP